MAKFLVSTECKAIVGSFVKFPSGGYRFLSWTQRGTSRKSHPTPEAAIPRCYRREGIIVVEADSADAAAKATYLKEGA